VLAVRRRVADAYTAMMAESLAPLDPNSDPMRHLDELTPEELAQAAWVFAHRPAQRVDFIGESALAQRQYRCDFARYGGSRPYLDTARRGKLEIELVIQLTPRVMQVSQLHLDEFPSIVRKRLEAILAKASDEELMRLQDLLLKEVWLVSDLLPPDPPPRPADWVAPPAGEYEPPAAELLARGPDLDTRWSGKAARDRVWTMPEARAALVRMATDPGLLAGWPADAASWAPFHAMTLLGELQAHEAAPELLRAIDVVRGDDWISDHLFRACLGLMGPAVEPVLWGVAGDRHRDPDVRGPALLALGGIAGQYPARIEAIAAALAGFLEQSPLLDRKRKTVNAFAAEVLHREPFGRDQDRAAILKADTAGLLDHKVFNPRERAGYGLDDWGDG
jgi:hypothetical protein